MQNDAGRALYAGGGVDIELTPDVDAPPAAHLDLGRPEAEADGSASTFVDVGVPAPAEPAPGRIAEPFAANDPRREGAAGRRPPRRPRWRSVVPPLAALALIWGAALGYLAFAPDVYRSHASLMIPGAGLGSSLNVDSVGQASTSIASPYSSHSMDPKVNYKAIATSSTVLDEAARIAELENGEYGRPDIRLVDQTSVLEIVFEGETAEGARLRTASLLESLEKELERLRRDERDSVRRGSLERLDGYQAQVAAAQKRLLDFRTLSKTVSPEQLDARLAALDRLRARRHELELELASTAGRVEVLSSATGLMADGSAEVIKLQQDRVLQAMLERYSTLNAEYLEKAAALGSGHPKLTVIGSRLAATKREMTRRAETLLGFSDGDFVDRYLPARNPDDANLYRDLVGLEATRVADGRELETLDALIERLEGEIQTQASNASTLAELERGYRVADTIFLSALAKLDLGESDIYASYPLTQLLVEPTLPYAPERLHRLLVVLGALFATLLVVAAALLIAHRDRWLRRLSRNA